MPFDFNQFIKPFDPMQFGRGAQMQQAPMQQLPPMRTLQDYYQPETRMNDEFMRMLQQQPQPNKPSLFKNIFGAMAALNAPQNPQGMADSIKYAPYYRALDQYKMQMPWYEKAADNERASNNINRQLATSQMQFDQQQQRINLLEDKEKNLVEYRNNEQARKTKLAEAKILKDSRPDLEWREINGTLYVIDPANPSKPIEVVKGMTDMEKLEFTAKARMQQIGAQQAGADRRTAAVIEGQNTRDTNNATPFNIIGPDGQPTSVLVNPTDGTTRPIRGVQGPLTRPSAPPRTSTGSGGNATLEQIRQRRLAAENFILHNPTLKKWITIPTSPNAPIDVKPPSTGGMFSSGPTQAEYDRIVQALGMNQTTSGLPNNSTKGAVPLPAGRIKVKGPNGETGSMDRSELANFPGWIEVK